MYNLFYNYLHIFFQNVLSLAQSNAESYPIVPDFQLQPHLTGLLPQQSKRVPELYPVDQYSNSTSKGSIATNMNPNYFSSNKSYPEPKIIEYDMEETSTESSPQHTSSLYSESTDQDSESTHPSSVFPRHTSFENTECHITKESKTIPFSNQEFPVPSQFADLSLNRDDSVDDHQHSILHSAFNQDDIIEDIPLSDNINQNEIESSIGNQENPKLQISEQGFSASRGQTFDYHANIKDFGQTEFKYENRQGSSPSISNNKTNYSPYNVHTSLNTQNSEELLLGQSNILPQPNSLNNSISQSQPSKPPSNIELFNRQQESQSVQNYNDIPQLGGYNQHNRYIQPVIQSSNVPSIDSKQQSNSTNNYNSQDKRNLNQSTSQAQKLHNKNNFESNTTNLCSQQNIQDIELINQQSMCSSPKSPVSEFLNDGQPLTSQYFTTYSSSLTSTQSNSPKTPAVTTDPTLGSSSSVSEAIVQENQNTSDDQTSGLFNLSDVDSPIDSINEDSTKVKSEFDMQFSQFPSSTVENQQETIVGQSESIGVQSNKSKPDNLKSQPIEQMFPVKIQPSAQLDSNDLQSSFNHFTSQQQKFDNDVKTSSGQFSNSPINLVSHSINSQSVPIQESKSTPSHSVGRYFDSVNASNQSVFTQGIPNIQSHSQQQNVHVQDVKPITSFASDKSNNFMTFSSNTHNNSIHLASSNQQSLQMKKDLEITENLKLDSCKSPEKTISLHPAKSDNLNVESLDSNRAMTLGSQATDNMTPIDQFSNMTINNQQNISVSQTYNQEKITSATSYFSKGTSLDDEDNIAFKNFSTLNTSSNTTQKSSEINNTLQYLKSEQTNPQYLISNQQTDHQIPPLPNNNQNVFEEKPNIPLVANQFSSQQFNHKMISSSVPSVTLASNQLPPQMLSNQAKSGAVSPVTPATSQNPTQFNNHSMQNVVSSQSNLFPSQVFSNEPKSNTEPSLQSTSNFYAKQPLDNQPKQNMIPPVSSAVNQFPPQMFSNHPKLDSVPSHHSSTSYSPQPSNNQPNLSTAPSVSSGINQYSSPVFSNQSKSDILQSTSISHPTQMLNKQPSSTTISPAVSDVNQFPQELSNQQKSGSLPPLPTTMNQNASNLFGNQTKPTIVSSVSTAVNQFSPNMFNGSAKSEIMPPLQKATDGYSVQTFNNQLTQNSVQSVSSVPNQLPPQAYGNLPNSGIMPPLQTAVSRYPAQSFSNQPTLNTVPPVSSSTKQLPQMFNNQSKSDDSSLRTTYSQYPSQPFNDQPKSNMTPLESSVTNQLPTQMSNNQPRLDIVSPLQSTTSQYPSQPFNNQPITNTFPPVALATNQLPPQVFSNQSRIDAGPSNKLMSNRYPSQPLSNQPLSGVSPTQSSTNQYPSKPLSNQSTPNPSLLPQSNTNQYSSQPFSNQPGQALSKPNQQPPRSNQFYNPSNSTQSTLNQWPPRSSMNQQSAAPILNANFPSQTSPVFPQPPVVNSLPLNVNQQTQGIGSQNLPPNPISNNYYNQVQSNLNVQQFQPPPVLPGQNVPLASKGYPQQNNMGYSSQINYQQPNTIRGQQGYLNQQQESCRPEQNSSVVQQGFAKTWVS